MLEIALKHRKRLNILCLGAHCDDIEIGCGGSLLKFQQSFTDTDFRWVVFSSDSERENEARTCAAKLLSRATRKCVEMHRYRNGYCPSIRGELKDYFEELKKEFVPDLVFTHYGEDLHQDHRVISELTWNTFRKNLILEYEIPKYDGDFGSPNLFITLDKTVCDRKIAGILSSFKSQSEKHWFTKELFQSVLRLRGMECASPTGYAEAFYCKKMILG